MQKTEAQFQKVLDNCQALFLNKVKDYGTSWRVLRTISLVDQIYIKAWRIRTLQEAKQQMIADSIEGEFIGIVNYGIIALIQDAIGDEDDNWDLSYQLSEQHYKAQAENVTALMLKKNHDYGEAWRDMSQQALADLILVKLLRIKQILANEGKTIVSEGEDANFSDIINYGIFALIKIEEAA